MVVRLISGTAAVATAVLAAGCGGRAEIDFGAEPGPSGGVCNAVVAKRALEGATHVPKCSPVTYKSNPPSSGNHYPIWGAFGVYSAPLPRGFWVHNLEHGAIVISYNCKQGCADDVTRAKAFVASPPADPECGSGGQRVLLVPDPLLDTSWAASAWGWTLRADCFDEAVFRGFYQAHYNQSPEDVCSPGQTLAELALPADCGK